MIRKTVLSLFFILFMLFANTSMAASLNDTIITLEKQTSGDIGVAVLDTKTNQIWSYKGNQRFPMMSTFKTLACVLVSSHSENRSTTSQSVGLESGDCPVLTVSAL